MPNITPQRLAMVELAMTVDAQTRTPESRRLVEMVDGAATAMETIESHARHFRMTQRLARGR